MRPWCALAAVLPFLLGAADPPQASLTNSVETPTRVPAASLPGNVGPVLQVHLGAAALDSVGIPNRIGNVDLGTTAVAAAKPTTFTVRNNGTGPLTLAEPIRLPRGFTLVRSFGTYTLAPGQATSFVVALNSAQAGKRTGQIAFRTNGSPDHQFRFTVSGTALGPPSLRILDDTDPGFRSVGRWSKQLGQGMRNSVVHAPAGKGTNVAAWTFKGLKPGLYQVSATWTPGDGRATNAPFTLVSGRGARTVAVNQQAPPSDFRDAGTVWGNVGTPLRVTGDTLVVQLSDRADGHVVADAVRVERVGFPGRILDAPDVAAERDRHTATWTFSNLVPGHYRISTSWPAKARGAASAPFTIHDGNRVVAKVLVNPQSASRDLRAPCTYWTDLGGQGNLFTIQGNSLVVHLSNPNGHTGPGPDPIEAGSVRIERIYNPAGEGGGSIASTLDTVRLLEQSTWGPNDALIAHVENDLGGDAQAFLNEQFNAPMSSYPTPPLIPDNWNAYCGGQEVCRVNNYTVMPVQKRFFTNALYESDQLRQRVAFALHQIHVVSGRADLGSPRRYGPYLQIFDRNAFGNYRDVLFDVSRHACMGYYLDILYSSPPRPNENYARELLQLFSVGLFQLHPDGTLQLDEEGLPIPTYTQDTVNNFARVFTGYIYAAPRMVGVTNYIDPMVQRNPDTESFHDRGAKTLLQYPNAVYPELPAGQRAIDDLNQSIDNIMYHPSVGPFVCKQLIQRLVTSNPSPNYVARVTAAFNDDGAGVRGNLRAVVQAILLDPEARGDLSEDPNFGHQRDPILFTCNVLRAFNATSHNGSTTSDGTISSRVAPLGMELFMPPSVFSYYPPDYNAPGHAPLLGPEFGILDSVSTLMRANFINDLTFGGGISVSTYAPNGTALNLTRLQGMTPAAMADYLNTLLLHGTMSDEMRTRLIEAINAVPAGNPLKRARTAVYLITTSSQYEIQH